MNSAAYASGASLLLAIAVMVLYLTRSRSRSSGAQVQSSAGEDLRRVLLDKRCLLQTALADIEDAVDGDASADTRWDSPRKVLRLLQGAPWLVAAEVISDTSLSEYEAATDHKCVWVVSRDHVELEYADAGVSFSVVVNDNLERGLTYRYLLVSSAAELGDDRYQERAGISVRVLPQSAASALQGIVDKYVVYSGGGSAPSCFYLYPGSNPRGWIRCDARSAEARLLEVEGAWSRALGPAALPS